MKVYFFVSVFSLLSYFINAGCNDGSMNWKFRHTPMQTVCMLSAYGYCSRSLNYTVQASEKDTVQINLLPNSSCGGGWGLISFSRNDSLLKPMVNGSTILIGCTRGEYKILLKGNYSWSDYLIRFSVHPLNYVGIDESAANTNFLEVYPNPATREVSIVNSSQQIQELIVQNSLGEVVLENYPTSNEAKINVEGLPKGVYYLTAILEDRKRLNKKIIVN